MKLVIYSKGGRRYLAVGEFREGKFVGEDELGRVVNLKEREVEFVCGEVSGFPDFGKIRGIFLEEQVREIWEIGEDLDIDTFCSIFGKNSAEFRAGAYLVLSSSPYFKVEGEKLIRRSEGEVNSIISSRIAEERRERILREIEGVLSGKRSPIVEKVLEIYNFGSGDPDVEKVIKRIPGFWERFIDAGFLGIKDIPHQIRELMVENNLEFFGREIHYEDLTHLETFSIDSEDTEDIDDAISVDGNKLYIHIALPYRICYRGSPADRFALRRGSTLYLPDGKWNMYPLEVVKDSSLLPGQERSTLTLEVDLGDYSYSFKVARVINKHKMSYKDAEGRLREMGIWEKLVRFAENLRDMRVKRGGIAVYSPFVKVYIKDNEVFVDVFYPNMAVKLITELMIFYNIKAGEFLAKHRIPAIYRIQDQKIEGEIPEKNDPLYYAKIKNLSRPVRSSTEPGPNLTIGAEFYVRATSPIRRYSDVINQHQILSILGYLEALDEMTVMEEMGTALSGEYKNFKAQRDRTNFLILYKLSREKRLRGIAISSREVFLPEYPIINTRSDVDLEVGKTYDFEIKRVSFAKQSLTLSPLE